MIEDCIEVALNDETQDRYVVFVREGTGPDEGSECVVASCTTQEEADRLRRKFHESGADCIVRFVGATGAGE